MILPRSLPIPPTDIAPQQVTRFYINTTTTLEDVSGFCWWSMRNAPACSPDPPPAPVTSCPWIGWQRVVVAGEEDIEWDCETPGDYGIGSITLTKKIGHQALQYCFCVPEEKNCHAVCRDL